MKTSRKSRIRQVFNATRRQMHQAISDGMTVGEETMKQLVPVDDGDLESTCRKRDDGQGHGMLMAGGFSEVSDKFVDYDDDVEFGTYKMAAQPFFRPAVDAAKIEISKKLKIVER